MQTWITELRQLGPQNLVLAIAGNKVDLESQRKVNGCGQECDWGRGTSGIAAVCMFCIAMYVCGPQ